jgi:two-component system, NarL family, response regulator LiaR
VSEAARTRVLLVDDEGVFAESAAAILSADERIEIVGVASDGEEAVELASELAPDLVLMDIGLPKVDGVAATRAIRQRCPDSQVVMLTGRRGRSEEESADAAGAIGYLHKDELGSPHLADSLLALVELT